MTIDDPISIQDGFKLKKQFIIFKNQLEAFTSNNLYILKECKENKRLLDLRYELSRTPNLLRVPWILPKIFLKEIEPITRRREISLLVQFIDN